MRFILTGSIFCSGPSDCNSPDQRLPFVITNTVTSLTDNSTECDMLAVAELEVVLRMEAI